MGCFLGLAGEYLNVIWGKYKQKQLRKTCGWRVLALATSKHPESSILISVALSEGTDRQADRQMEGVWSGRCRKRRTELGGQAWPMTG